MSAKLPRPQAFFGRSVQLKNYSLLHLGHSSFDLQLLNLLFEPFWCISSGANHYQHYFTDMSHKTLHSLARCWYCHKEPQNHLYNTISWLCQQRLNQEYRSLRHDSFRYWSPKVVYLLHFPWPVTTCWYHFLSWNPFF